MKVLTRAFSSQISEVIEQSYPANSVSSVQALNIAGDLEPSARILIMYRKTVAEPDAICI
jgi:hypothetical protein